MKIQAWMQRQRRSLIMGVPLFFLSTLFFIFVLGGRFVSTDDAYVQASKASISPNVPGQVAKMFVHDNQHVRAGNPLFSLDDRPYRIALENAQAKLINARLQVEVLKANYKQANARVVEAQQTFEYEQIEFERQERLHEAGISSDMQVNTAMNQYQTAEQQLQAAKEQLAAVLGHLNNNPDIPMEEHPIVQQAQADLDHAALNLEYTIILAPFDGIVTKVENLQVGDYVKAGEAAFALISEKNIWVEANFKETEITNIRPGQPATVKIDAYPRHKFTGKVQSLSPGTGASFSLLPPENATGNWVKIVQRVPIRIAIDASDVALNVDAGLSATVTVDTKNRAYPQETHSSETL